MVSVEYKAQTTAAKSASRSPMGFSSRSWLPLKLIRKMPPSARRKPSRKRGLGLSLIHIWAKRLRGCEICLDFPSVGATENLMMAATLAQGVTTIQNAAREPEIVELQNFLNAMGARVKGGGSNSLRIEGVDRLRGAEHVLIPDRIEAGTYMVMALATKGQIYLENVIPEHFEAVIAKLREAGAVIREEEGGLWIGSPEKLKPVDCKTMPYPGFPTDMQAQLMALMTRCV